MHAQLIERLAEARQRGLKDSASQATAAGSTSRRCRHVAARRRVGWLLVEIGLKLVGGPGGA